MSVKYRSIPTKTLAQNLSSSGTTLYTNNTLDWDDAQLSSADFGTQAFALLRNASNTQIELIEIDPTTVTSAAAITISKRGLPYDGTQVANTETKYNWSAFDTYVELGSDTPQMLQYLKDYIDGIAVAGSPDASLTAKGIVEMATTAEIDADDDTGSTSAPTAIGPGQLAASKYGTRLPSAVEKTAIAGSQGTLSSTNKLISQDNTSSDTTDQTQTTQDSTIETGEADATGKKNLIAQSFIPAKTKIRGVKIYKSADTGTFTGDVVVTLQADSAGSPSGTPLATSTIANATWVISAVGEIECLFSSEYTSMTIGSLYWIVIDPSTSDNSNHPNVGTNTAGGYTSGSVKYKNTTDSWVAVSNIDLYFKTMEGNVSQIVKTNTSGKIESAFYDVTELPAIVYQQRISVDSSYTAIYGCGAAPDGSAFYTLHNGTTLDRYERDTLTGMYVKTHTASVNGGFDGQAGIIQIGSYIYMFGDDNTNVMCYRYLAADLTGEQSMTVPVVANANNNVGAWTDGTYAYIVAQNSPTTSRKWSVSGTTFSAVSTATVTTGIFYVNNSCSVYDGTNTYIIDNNTTANTILIRKLTAIDGSAYTTTSKLIRDSSGNDAGVLGIPQRSGSGVMYIGHLGIKYNATSTDGAYLNLIPVTKP